MLTKRFLHLSHRLRLRLFIWGTCLLAAMATVGYVGRLPDNYFEIAKNIEIFGKVLHQVNENYVDEVEVNRFVRFGIDAMLQTLDPYTNYISASEIEDYRFLSTGQYGGIGTMTLIRDSTDLLIAEVVENSPAHKAGLQPGDVIVQIDKEVLSGTLDHEKVDLLMKGQPKTKVFLKVRRPGQAQVLEFTVSRDEIRVNNVDYYGLMKGNVAYISQGGFTREAGLEVRRAIEAMRQQAGGRLGGIILDLRNNPGGLLDEAINTSNLFINKGELVVETRGRLEGIAAYKAPNPPADIETPLVVLVNTGSASASEIVAGVVQDLDRGVIVGRRSYGKGLVQSTLQLNSYNARVKMTTARYYTPSGRCIQAVDYQHSDYRGGIVRRADSTQREFRTRRGRPVKDGGGIEPEVAVKSRDFHKVVYELRNNFMLFDYATHYRSKHPQIAAAKDFTLTDADFQDFLAFVRQQKFTYTSRAESETQEWLKNLKQEKYFDQIAPQVQALHNEIKRQSEHDIIAYKDVILYLLKMEIASRYYFKKGEREASFLGDDDIDEALRVLAEPARYNKLLTAVK